MPELARFSNKDYLEPVCCKKWQKKFMNSYWFRKEGISRGFEGYKIDPK